MMKERPLPKSPLFSSTLGSVYVIGSSHPRSSTRFSQIGHTNPKGSDKVLLSPGLLQETIVSHEAVVVLCHVPRSRGLEGP